MKSTNSDIDAVICWVDGNDPQHYRKRQQALGKADSDSAEELATSTDTTRFLDNGELYYCIKSIRKCTPWVRTIHLVTDNQKPDFLTEDFREQHNVRVVDHTDIFRSYESYLPVFSSRTIETALWRIPDLAPRFLYFNDDFVLTGSLKPEEFFRDDKVVLRGNWNKAPHYGTLRITANKVGTFLSKNLLGITRSMHLLLQIRSANLAGYEDSYFRVPHVPHPIKTDTLKSWFEDHPDLFEKNISYKFRHPDQFSALHLAHHLEIKNDRAVLKSPDDYMMINGEMDFGFTITGKLKKIRDEKIEDIRFRAKGCPAAIASTSVTTELALGKTLEEALKITKQDVVIALDGLPDNKIKCSVLGPNAIENAVSAYRKAQNEEPLTKAPELQENPEAEGPQILDLRGKSCPMTFVYTKVALESIEAGKEIKVILDYPPAFTNVPNSVLKQKLGTILKKESHNDEMHLFIKK